MCFGLPNDTERIPYCSPSPSLCILTYISSFHHCCKLGRGFFVVLYADTKLIPNTDYRRPGVHPLNKVELGHVLTWEILSHQMSLCACLWVASTQLSHGINTWVPVSEPCRFLWCPWKMIFKKLQTFTCRQWKYHVYLLLVWLENTHAKE